MKILVADDHELFLRGLEFILKTEFQDTEVVSAESYTEIFEKLSENENIDLIITDLAMPGSNWLDALTRMRSLAPDAPIIIISAVFDKEILQKTLDIGVSGYIPKSSSKAVMVSAISLVKAGGVYIPRELLANTPNNNKGIMKDLEMLKSFSDEAQKPSKKLTPRQIDVIKMAAKGLSNKQIAYELGLTEGTIKVHLTVVLKALGVNNRTAAVLEAVRYGYINKSDVKY